MADASELADFRSMVRQFVATEIEPNNDRWEHEGFFDAHDLFPKLGRLGLLGLTFDPEYGGGGAEPEFEKILIEELGRSHQAGVAMAVSVQNCMATPSLNRFGSPELKEKYLRPALTGEHVAAIAVTEPGAGSDVAAVTTKAHRDGDDWIINGAKTFITNGTQADWFCMLVRTGDEGGYRGMSQIIVEAGTPGFEVARKLNKLGNRASDTAELHLSDVRVPVANTIGTPGRGFQQQMQQFVVERMSAVYLNTGAVRRALEKTHDYLQVRETFGVPLAKRQYVAFTMAELTADLELLEAINDKACAKYAAGHDITREATVAKLHGGRLARKTADMCLQFHGGLGYMEENWTAQFIRDSRLGSIGGGADEVMLQVLAKQDGYEV